MRMKILSVVVAMTAITVQADIPGENGPGSGGCPSVDSSMSVSDAILEGYFKKIRKLNSEKRRLQKLQECYLTLLPALTLDQAVVYTGEIYRDSAPVALNMMDAYIDVKLKDLPDLECLRGVVMFSTKMDDGWVVKHLGLCNQVRNTLNLEPFDFIARMKMYIDLPIDYVEDGLTDALILKYVPKHFAELDESNLKALRKLLGPYGDDDFDDIVEEQEIFCPNPEKK